MRRTTAILLSVVILISNLGISFTTHYCGGKAVKSKFSVGISELTCGMADADTSCKHGLNTEQLTEKNCCNNLAIHFEIDNDYNGPAEELTKEDQQSISTFIINALCVGFTHSTRVKQNFNYLHPPLVQDIPVLTQCFLF